MCTSSAVDRRFEPRSGQTEVYKIGICCFSAKHTALRRKTKDWLARNRDNVSEWCGMFIRGLLFRWASTIKIQLSVYKGEFIIISLKTNLFSPWYSWKMAELALNNNHSLTHLIYSFLLPLWHLQNFLVYILENFEDKKGVSFHTNIYIYNIWSNTHACVVYNGKLNTFICSYAHLFSFPIFRFCLYLIKVIPEMHCAIKFDIYVFITRNVPPESSYEVFLLFKRFEIPDVWRPSIWLDIKHWLFLWQK